MHSLLRGERLCSLVSGSFIVAFHSKEKFKLDVEGVIQEEGSREVSKREESAGEDSYHTAKSEEEEKEEEKKEIKEDKEVKFHVLFRPYLSMS